MTEFELWLLRQLPISPLPGLRVREWIEVREADGVLFTVSTIRWVCDWFTWDCAESAATILQWFGDR